MNVLPGLEFPAAPEYHSGACFVDASYIMHCANRHEAFMGWNKPTLWGALVLFSTIRKEYGQQHAVVVWDSAKHIWDSEAHLIAPLLALSGWRVLYANNYRVQDLLASAIVRSRVSACVVVSDCRDLYQHAQSQKISFLSYAQGGFEFLGATQIRKNWGLPPSKLRLFFALLGDSTYGQVPIPGITPTRARHIVAQYPSLSTLLKAIERRDPLVADLWEFQEAVLINLELGNPDRTVPIMTTDPLLEQPLNATAKSIAYLARMPSPLRYFILENL